MLGILILFFISTVNILKVNNTVINSFECSRMCSWIMAWVISEELPRLSIFKALNSSPPKVLLICSQPTVWNWDEDELSRYHRRWFCRCVYSNLRRKPREALHRDNRCFSFQKPQSKGAVCVGENDRFQIQINHKSPTTQKLMSISTLFILTNGQTKES